MSLNLGIANKPALDANGYCIAELVDIAPPEQGELDGIDPSSTLAFYFCIPGTQQPILKRLLTGNKLNPETDPETGKLYMFSRLMVKLGLATVEGISKLDALGPEKQAAQLKILGEQLESLKGKKMRLRLVPDAKKSRLAVIDIDSISIDAA